MTKTPYEIAASDRQTAFAEGMQKRLPEFLLAPRRDAAAVAFWGTADALWAFEDADALRALRQPWYD